MKPTILSFPEVKSIVLCGDIHGEFHAFVEKLLRQLVR